MFLVVVVFILIRHFIDHRLFVKYFEHDLDMIWKSEKIDQKWHDEIVSEIKFVFEEYGEVNYRYVNTCH